MTLPRTISLGFLAVITVGTILLTLPISGTSGTWNSPLVALFTSTSAVCVTGLNVIDPGTYFSFWGQLFIVLLIQVGGLGYMTMTTLLVLILGRRIDYSQKQAIQDSFDRPFLQGSKNLIISIVATTLIFELTAAFGLTIVFAEKFPLNEALWLGIFHSVSAWNNAGFGLFKDNLIGYQTSFPVNLIITGLIIFGGIGYQVIIEMYYWLEHLRKKETRRFNFSLNFKVVTSTTIFLLLAGTMAFVFAEFNNAETMGNLSLSDKLLASWFHSVTTRTAGFNSIDVGKMTIGSLIITMALMFIGGSPGGTAGGIKTTTLRIINSCTRSVLQGHERVIIYRRQVSVNLVFKAIAVVFGSALTVIIGTFLIAFQNDNDSFNTIQILFEVISAFATVGLSTGITPQLSGFEQIVIIITMYIGRVGILLLMAAILGNPRPSMLQYPEENLLVG